MKTLNIPLEDKEFNKLLKEKGKKSWKEFIMELVDRHIIHCREVKEAPKSKG